jgi:hypothetical protein
MNQVKALFHCLYCRHVGVVDTFLLSFFPILVAAVCIWAGLSWMLNFGLAREQNENLSVTSDVCVGLIPQPRSPTKCLWIEKSITEGQGPIRTVEVSWKIKQAMLCWSLSSRHSAYSGRGWRRRPRDIDGSWEYIEYAVMVSRQGVVLQLVGWARG